MAPETPLSLSEISVAGSDVRQIINICLLHGKELGCFDELTFILEAKTAQTACLYLVKSGLESPPPQKDTEKLIEDIEKRFSPIRLRVCYVHKRNNIKTAILALMVDTDARVFYYKY